MPFGLWYFWIIRCLRHWWREAQNHSWQKNFRLDFSFTIWLCDHVCGCVSSRPAVCLHQHHHWDPSGRHQVLVPFSPTGCCPCWGHRGLVRRSGSCNKSFGAGERVYTRVHFRVYPETPLQSHVRSWSPFSRRRHSEGIPKFYSCCYWFRYPLYVGKWNPAGQPNRKSKLHKKSLQVVTIAFIAIAIQCLLRYFSQNFVIISQS